MILYLDTSAFLKLVVDEEHSDHLRERLSGADVWSSSLLDIEAHRAARRLGVPDAEVDDYLDAVTLVDVRQQTLSRARTCGTSSLRTLDALHLATALELGSDLHAVVTYDPRLASGCVAERCAVLAPGRDGAWWESVSP